MGVCDSWGGAMFWLSMHSRMVAFCELFVHELSTVITCFKIYKLFINKILWCFFCRGLLPWYIFCDIMV